MTGTQRGTGNAVSFPGVAARAHETDVAGRIHPASWQETADSGYLRMFHAPELGGTGADVLAQLEAMETLARACPATYWTATVSGLLCAKLIARYSPASEHARLLEPVLSGEKLACFAIVERGAGSDAATLQTLVRPAGAPGEGYLISGEKSRIANAAEADLAVTVVRRHRPAEEGGPEWCLAFVDLRRPGVRRYDIPRMGLRGMPWGGIVFTDAHVAETDVVPVPFGELGGELSESMAWGWLLIAVAAVGIAESALDASVRHARERVSFGRPLMHMEGVQAQLADARVRIDAARTLARRALAEKAAGRPARDLIAMLKIYATEMAVDVTAAAVQIHGASGVTQGHEVERLYRDAQMNVIGGFTSNRLREVVAEGLGLGPAVYSAFDWLKPTGLGKDPVGFDGLREPAGSPS
jgi:alkylation response protein AidB-like acyl-CoA dehydrogenase